MAKHSSLAEILTSHVLAV